LSTPGIQYVINATLGDLRALDQLHRQLLNLRELAERGADFSIRIDPEALNGLKESVARTVAEGVRSGGGRVKAAGGVGSGENVQMGAVVDELRIAVNLLRTLAERQGQSQRTAAPPAATMPPGSATNYVDDTSDKVTGLRARRETVGKFISKLQAVRKQDAVEMAKALEEYVAQFKSSPESASTFERRLSQLTAKATFGKKADERLNALDDLTKWFDRVQVWLKDQQQNISRQLRDAEKHLGTAMGNQGYDPTTGANNPIKNGRRTASTGQGFAIDAAAITAAFEKAADAFGARMMQYIPEGGAGGGHVPVIQTGSGRYSTPAGGGNASSALMYKKCLVCNGSGRFKSGGVCWRCGGSGDENHPDVNNPELQAALTSGQAKIAKVGNAQSNPLQGSATVPIIPHSVEQRNTLLGHLDKLNKTYYKSGLNDDDRNQIAAKMQPLLEELEQGGVPRARFHGAQRVVNGVYVTQREYEYTHGGVDAKGNKFAPPNPNYVAEAVSQGVKYNPNDPIRMTQTHINGLAAAIDNLQKIDMTKTESAFRELGATVHKLAEDMKTASTQGGILTRGGNTLTYTKMLNDEKERHKQAMNQLKDNGATEVEAERVKARAQRLLNADTLTRQAMGLGGVTQISDDVLQARIGRGFKRLGRYTTRAEDLEGQSRALYSAGLPIDENSMDRLRNLSNFTATRGTLFKDLEQAYNGNPKKYAALSGISGINYALNKNDDINFHLRNYENADNDYSSLLFRSKQKTTPEIQKGIQDANLKMAAAQQALAGLGIKGNTLPEMKGEAAKFATETDASAKSMLKLAGAQHEQILATEQQSKVWDRLAIKFRDIFAYLVSGTLIYGAVNAARKALSETMKFEADMADVQGIFITKSQTQRDQVKAGVMKSAEDFGVDRSAVAGIAKLFAQTGASPEKTMAMTRSTLLAQKGAGLDAGQASEMLIAVDNLTKGAVTPADIIDRISRVEARHAVTAQDLSTIIQRAGPMAAHLQPEQRGSEDALDMLMGMGTTLIEKTRVTGNQAGTTLKFLMARLSAPEVQRKLQDKFGIMLGERNSGEMRGMTDIFGDIAGQYNKFKSSGETGKAAALLTTFAGARQANAAAALFDDWKSSMDVAKESSIAFGDSQRRLAIQMDTLQTKVGQAGAALNNMATVMIEKTGLLDLMKVGATATAGAAGFMAEHPVITAIGGAVALRGLQGWLSAFKAGEGATAVMSTFGKIAPTLGSVLSKLNVIGLAATTFQLAEKAVYETTLGTRLSGAYDAIKHGSVSGAMRELSSSDGHTFDEVRRDNELHGAEKFDRETYKQSDQGKAYAALANKYGLSSDSFYNKVSEASDLAMQDAEKKFGVKAAHSDDNPKLARFLEDEFTKHLQVMLPGFDSVKDEAEATAEALHMLRESIPYGGVAYFAQQGGLSEKAQQAGQEFMQNANMTAGTKLKGSFPLMMGDPGGTVFGLPTNPDYYKTIAPKDIGMYYSKDVAHRLGHGTFGEQVGDARSILNDMSGPLGIGNALSTTHIGGSGSLTMLGEAIRIMRAGEFAGRGINSLGQALDAFSTTIKAAPLEELARIKSAGGKRTASDQETLDANDRYNNLLDQIQGNIHQGLHIDERKQAAKDGSKDVEIFGGGGEFAQMIMEMQQKAVKNLMELPGVKADSRQMKALQEFEARHFSPGNRERTKLDIIGALNGVNMRAYLKDKVMDEFLRFAGREGEIKLSEQYMGQTGASFNANEERASNAGQFLQGMIKVTAGMPIERMRAEHKLSLALRARSSISGEAFTDDLTADMPEGERQVMTKNMNDELSKLLKSGKLNDTQVRQLGIQLATIKAAAKEWSTGKPDEMFDTLPDADKNLLKSMMGIDDANLGALALTNSEAFLQLATHKYAHTNSKTAEDTLSRIALSGANARSSTRVRSVSAYRDLQLQQGLGLAEAHTDRTDMLNIRREMVTAARDSAIAMASETQRGSLRTIYQQAKQNGAVDSFFGTINEKSVYFQQAQDAGEAFKTAVEEAYQSAQNNMTQLLDQQHLEYVKRVEDHTDSMIKGLTDPLTSALSDPHKLFSSHIGGETVTAIGAFANQKIAASFMDNLFGPEGMFSDKLGGLMQSPIFQEASLIKMAHIDGIVQGFRTVGLLDHLNGIGGGFSGGGGISGGSLSLAGGDGVGTALSAGIAATGLVGSGIYAAFSGTGTVKGKTVTVSTTGSSNPKGPMALVKGNPNMGVTIGPDGSTIVQGALGAAVSVGGGLDKSTKAAQRSAALWQLATLAAVYGSSMIFGGNKKYSDGSPKNYASEGSQVGSMVGSMTPLGPVGAVVGAVVGGLLGSLFHRKPPPKNTPEYEALVKIERNTRESVDAITNQTRNLLSPENRLLYTPSTFSMPQMQPFGSGSSADAAAGAANITVEVNINAGERSTADLAAEIAGHIKAQLNTVGTFTNSRY
jgi:hypothetical protein